MNGYIYATTPEGTQELVDMDWDGPPEWDDEVDPDDVDISDLLYEFEPHFYDGSPESGPCEPTSWIESVDRRNCEERGCGKTAQRVLKHRTINEHFDAMDIVLLACGHWQM